MEVLKGSNSIEFIEKKSKFIGYIKSVNTRDEAVNFINDIKKEHFNATHNVPVYRVMENGQEYFKYDDDGEPQNTAGKPMADIFERKNVYNFAMVATRYFGGIKLGAGGLIRAYAKVAKELYENSEIEEYIEKNYYIIILNYDKLSSVERIINEYSIEIVEKSYLEKINFKLYLSEEEKREFENIRDIDIIKI